VVELVDEAVVHVEHVGEAASHARTEVVTGLAQNADKAAGHVFTAVIASALDNSVAGVTHSEALARGACGKQLAASGAVQAGVADDGAVLGFERAAGGGTMVSLPPVMPLPT
jgi:hypothetical protein